MTLFFGAMILFWILTSARSRAAPQRTTDFLMHPQASIGLGVVDGVRTDDVADYLEAGGEARKSYLAAMYQRMEHAERATMEERQLRLGQLRRDAERQATAPAFVPEEDDFDEEDIAMPSAPAARSAAPVTNVSVGPIHLTAAPTPAPVVVPVDEHPMRHSVYFKAGEPQMFAEYGSQEQVIKQLRYAIGALDPDDVALQSPTILLGSAGLGKTLLARVLANELDFRALTLGLPNVRFIEVLGTELTDRARLDSVLRECEANPGCVLFIDETHGVTGTAAQLMLPLLDEHRYGYLNQAPRRLAPFTILGATTDFGLLPAPLRRRWTQHQLGLLSAKEISLVLQRRAVSLQRRLGAEARRLIVERVAISGAPWEAVRLLGLAHDIAKTHDTPEILPAQVEEVFQMVGMDQYGLDRIDRSCIRALGMNPAPAPRGQEGVIYRASEAAVIAMANVDPEYYRAIVKPRLMSRGLLMIRGGQLLTPKAVELYADLLA
jgi:holliday junction DNA helicase RuvB